MALGHEQRKLAEEYARAGSRLSVARLELERLGQKKTRGRGATGTSRALVAEKEQARVRSGKGSWKWSAARVQTIAGSCAHRRRRACARCERSMAGPRGAGAVREVVAGKARYADQATGRWRRRIWRPSWSGWESSGLGCWLTMVSSLDWAAGAIGCAAAAGSAVSNSGCAQEREGRAARWPDGDALKGLRI